MDICDKVLSRSQLSWSDVQKQILSVIQTRSSSIQSNINSSSSLPINKIFLRQCTDLLIKHIKSDIFNKLIKS